MMEEDEFLGCISCMSATDLYDLFSVYEENGEAYANMFETCFDIKIPANVKYLCSECADQLEKAVTFKEQTAKSVTMLKNALSQDEEYLDEKILEEEETITKEENVTEDHLEIEKKESDGEYEENEEEEPEEPVYDPPMLQECHICGLSVDHLELHLDRCHSAKAEVDNRKYPCHFCDNIYISKKACFTHLRMKHGLKLCTEQTPKFVQRERKKCHMCSRDFSQKQILNKHLWKAHGLEVEKRKAFICPLCSERVSYGANFSAHLLHAHRVREHVERLQFHSMDDFLLFKSAIQEETKYRFRKTTASKQTIEGVRSHYMCSQSGVYVYQGKGKRPAPERQIYKTGKACPAHMIVTETMDNVLVTFYKTHVGHGPCPYFEPREPKKPKLEQPSSSYILPGDMEETLDGGTVEEAAICDLCGLVCSDAARFKTHVASHARDCIPCQYCHHDFQDLDAWTHHIRVEHNMAIF